ncbi:hypothetical protein QVA70_13720, partial [Staphylococcus aureus]|nr:hypothetical protein [Staphylococcus aureus]
HVKVLLGMFLSLKTLYRKRTVIWPFYFYTIIRTLSNFYFENIEYKMFDSLKEVNNFIEKTYKYVLHIGLDKKERLKKTEKELLNS